MRADWSKIIAGDIVKFAYRGRNSTQFRTRTCLILNEKHYHKRKTDGRTVRLVHAIQLAVTPPRIGERDIRVGDLNRVMKAAGKLEIRDGRYAIETSEPRIAAARQQYIKLEKQLKLSDEKMYKTFTCYKLRQRAVNYYTQFNWPLQLVEELEKKSPLLKEY